jgi:hypothetical protein
MGIRYVLIYGLGWCFVADNYALYNVIRHIFIIFQCLYVKAINNVYEYLTIDNPLSYG